MKMAENKSIVTISEIVINKDNGLLKDTDAKLNAINIQNEKEFNDLKKCLFLFMFLLCFLVFSFFFAEFFLFELN
jgi:hypothetical protein